MTGVIFGVGVGEGAEMFSLSVRIVLVDRVRRGGETSFLALEKTVMDDFSLEPLATAAVFCPLKRKIETKVTMERQKMVITGRRSSGFGIGSSGKSIKRAGSLLPINRDLRQHTEKCSGVLI